MLAEYFQIRFDAEGNVTALPQLIPGYVPAMQLLPMFLLRLTTEVDWSAEAPCLNGICREVAAFYCLRPGVAALHSQHPTHPDNVQALTSGAGGSAAVGDVAMSAAEAAAVAAMEEEERRACCRGTCGPRLEKGDMLDAGVEAGVDAALAAVLEGSVDALVADARERRKRLHWCAPASPPPTPHPSRVACRLQQHVLLPDIRAFMLPPESMASDGSIIQVTQRVLPACAW
jgi:hypothetical protein